VYAARGSLPREKIATGKTWQWLSINHTRCTACIGHEKPRDVRIDVCKRTCPSARRTIVIVTDRFRFRLHVHQTSDWLCNATMRTSAFIRRAGVIVRELVIDGQRGRGRRILSLGRGCARFTISTNRRGHEALWRLRSRMLYFIRIHTRTYTFIYHVIDFYGFESARQNPPNR